MLVAGKVTSDEINLRRLQVVTCTDDGRRTIFIGCYKGNLYKKLMVSVTMCTHSQYKEINGNLAAAISTSVKLICEKNGLNTVQQ